MTALSNIREANGSGGSGGNNYSYTLIASGSGAQSVTYTSTVSGTYKLLVIAMNSEAETRDLTISASLNNNTLSGNTLRYNGYTASTSSDDRRNYRVNVYDITIAADDEISLAVTNATEYTSIIYAIIDGNFDTISKAVTNCDNTAVGIYPNKAIVVYGTSDADSGEYNGELYTAGVEITTEYPGSSYTSAFIFWLTDSSIGNTGISVRELLDEAVVGSSESITLNDSIANYDILEFKVGIYAESKRQYFTTSILVNDIYSNSADTFFVGGTIVGADEFSAWYSLAYEDATHLDIVSSNQHGWNEDRTIFSIKGIKIN